MQVLVEWYSCMYYSTVVSWESWNLIERRVHEIHIFVYCEWKIYPIEDTFSAGMYVRLRQLVTYLTRVTYSIGLYLSIPELTSSFLLVCNKRSGAIEVIFPLFLMFLKSEVRFYLKGIILMEMKFIKCLKEFHVYSAGHLFFQSWSSINSLVPDVH